MRRMLIRECSKLAFSEAPLICAAISNPRSPLPEQQETRLSLYTMNPSYISWVEALLSNEFYPTAGVPSSTSKYSRNTGPGQQRLCGQSGRLTKDYTPKRRVGSSNIVPGTLSGPTCSASHCQTSLHILTLSHSGGAYVSNLSTCFLTSNLLQDLDPWAVSQGNRRVDITKLEFYGGKVIRDKVRCPDRPYMVAGAAVHPSSETTSVIFCTQGTLHEAAGLVCIEARRPHTARMILNNFHGKPFNSPSEVISNPVDKAVYFTVSTALDRMENSSFMLLDCPC